MLTTRPSRGDVVGFFYANTDPDDLDALFGPCGGFFRDPALREPSVKGFIPKKEALVVPQ